MFLHCRRRVANFADLFRTLLFALGIPPFTVDVECGNVGFPHQQPGPVAGRPCRVPASFPSEDFLDELITVQRARGEPGPIRACGGGIGLLPGAWRVPDRSEHLKDRASVDLAITLGGPRLNWLPRLAVEDPEPHADEIAPPWLQGCPEHRG